MQQKNRQHFRLFSLIGFSRVSNVPLFLSRYPSLVGSEELCRFFAFGNLMHSFRHGEGQSCPP